MLGIIFADGAGVKFGAFRQALGGTGGMFISGGPAASEASVRGSRPTPQPQSLPNILVSVMLGWDSWDSFAFAIHAKPVLDQLENP